MKPAVASVPEGCEDSDAEERSSGGEEGRDARRAEGEPGGAEPGSGVAGAGATAQEEEPTERPGDETDHVPSQTARGAPPTPDTEPGSPTATSGREPMPRPVLSCHAAHPRVPPPTREGSHHISAPFAPQGGAPSRAPSPAAPFLAPPPQRASQHEDERRGVCA